MFSLLNAHLFALSCHCFATSPSPAPLLLSSSSLPVLPAQRRHKYAHTVAMAPPIRASPCPLLWECSASSHAHLMPRAPRLLWPALPHSFPSRAVPATPCTRPTRCRRAAGRFCAAADNGRFPLPCRAIPCPCCDSPPHRQALKADRSEARGVLRCCALLVRMAPAPSGMGQQGCLHYCYGALASIPAPSVLALFQIHTKERGRSH